MKNKIRDMLKSTVLQQLPSPSSLIVPLILLLIMIIRILITIVIFVPSPQSKSPFLVAHERSPVEEAVAILERAVQIREFLGLHGFNSKGPVRITGTCLKALNPFGCPPFCGSLRWGLYPQAHSLGNSLFSKMLYLVRGRSTYPHG